MRGSAERRAGAGSPDALGALVARVGARLDTAGLDVRGVVAAADWDAAVAAPFRCAARLPGARAAWILGAGRALFAAAAAGPDAAADHPLDRHTRRAAREAARGLAAAGWRVATVPGFVRRAGAFPDLVAAGRAAGLGWPSRLGLLLHPERGPWWSLRAALLTDAPLRPGAPRPEPAPCTGCEAPCTRVCPAGAPGPDGFDVPACGAVRAAGRCAARCDARRACPEGAAHRYDPADEARLMRRSRPAMVARAGRGGGLFPEG